MTLIAHFFPILRSLKNLIKYMSEKSILRGPYERQDRKPLQTLLVSERQHRFHI